MLKLSQPFEHCCSLQAPNARIRIDKPHRLGMYLIASMSLQNDGLGLGRPEVCRRWVRQSRTERHTEFLLDLFGVISCRPWPIVCTMKPYSASKRNTTFMWGVWYDIIDWARCCLAVGTIIFPFYRKQEPGSVSSNTLRFWKGTDHLMCTRTWVFIICCAYPRPSRHWKSFLFCSPFCDPPRD